MKLLIITQKVDRNDPVLGFFHRWIEEFSKHCESVVVICLERGEFDLPKNVKVLSLGKEEGKSRLKYLWRFYKYLWLEHKNYDKVFVHMNPVYVVLAGWWWRLLKKKIVLWYTHKQIGLKLWAAIFFVNKIATASEEGFAIATPKRRILGHGVDVQQFSVPKEKQPEIGIFHIGRITKIKNCETLIMAASLLLKDFFSFHVTFVGVPITADDVAYQEKLRGLICSRGLRNHIFFMGGVTYRQLPQIFAKATITVNMAPTGGLDKAVLESMAAAVPVFSSNAAFTPYFSKFSSVLSFRFGDYKQLAEKIRLLLTEGNLEDLGFYLRERVVTTSDIGALVRKIISLYKHD